MSKETILKGFRSEFSEYLRPKTIGVFDSILLANEFEEYLTKSIDQTREETIRDLLSSVQENRDEFFKGENDRGRLYYNGLIDLLNKILNKLKK